MKCTNCGTENMDYAVYCLQCGQQLQAPPRYETPEPEPVKPEIPKPPVFQPLAASVNPLPRGNGVLTLIFGVLSLVTCCVPLGVIAWIMGSSDLNKMRSGLLARTDETITQTGRVLGIISTILFLLTIVFVVLIILLGLELGGAEHLFDL